MTHPCQPGGARSNALLAGLLTLGGGLLGCIHADMPYNPPQELRIRLESVAPQNYSVAVADQAEVPVSSDGRVVLEVPSFARGRSTYLVGIVKVGESSPYDVPVVELRKAGKAVRRFSLNDLNRLARDSDGYALLRPE